MSLGIVTRAVFVALIAAVMAGLPMAAFVTIGMRAEFRFIAVSRMMLLSFAGALLLGLPIAMLIFRSIADDASFGFRKLAFIANVAAIVLIAPIGANSGWFGLMFFGVPILLAANTFLVAGWFLLLKPFRMQRIA